LGFGSQAAVAARIEDAPQNDAEFIQYRAQRVAYWNEYQRTRAGSHYRSRLAQIYRSLIPRGQRVLEVGCGSGDLLAAVDPAYGLGIDFAPQMIETARATHPELDFEAADAHEFGAGEKFDYVILSDLVNDLWDVQQTFQQIAAVCDADTRIIINSYSRAWELPLAAARRLRLANPVLGQNWLTVDDIQNLLTLSGFEVIRTWQEVLCPLRVPILDSALNRYLVRFPILKHAALSNFLIARVAPTEHSPAERHTSVSVIVPARNEAGNIESILQRVPEMGAGTEIIFVEGNSSDHTYEEIERRIRETGRRRCKLLKQTGKGKGDAVRAGFAAASGDVLMILDADLTVPPEDLPRFLRALVSGTGEFVNGVRLIYPMQDEAMRFANLIGNKFFSWAFTFLLNQSVKDTLCGTKVLRRSHYQKIAENRSYFGDFDPFGDFDLLFGASRLNLKIVDLPVRYRKRVYGETNIQRWKHGVILLRMAAFASRRIKFV
jgi:ubiquinone/menaquinone biosynthesis C-methylase UbiE